MDEVETGPVIDEIKSINKTLSKAKVSCWIEIDKSFKIFTYELPELTSKAKKVKEENLNKLQSVIESHRLQTWSKEFNSNDDIRKEY